jgi:hypothetical protein
MRIRAVQVILVLDMVFRVIVVLQSMELGIKMMWV